MSCPLYRGCPLFRGSVIRDFTVYALLQNLLYHVPYVLFIESKGLLEMLT